MNVIDATKMFSNKRSLDARKYRPELVRRILAHFRKYRGEFEAWQEEVA